jgi:asparagine synthase (glutamine-hydrolysing)
LDATLHADHSYRKLPFLLQMGDGISMARSIESRLPFLDHRLVEFIFGLPFTLKMHGATTKYVLRRAFRDELPREIRLRRDKIGFEAPLRRWLRPTLERDAREFLLSGLAVEQGFLDRRRLGEALDQCAEGGEWRANLVFRALSLEAWARQYYGRAWAEAPHG